MMLPLFCSIIVAKTALEQRYGPLRLAATLRSQISGAISSRVSPSTMTPALFTRTSILPYMSMV